MGHARAGDAFVRTAGQADVDIIGAIHHRSWTRAYRDVLGATLAELTPAGLARTWSAAVTDPPTPGHVVLVACAASMVVGFAAVDPAGEVVALHVDPTQQRRGHGSRLLNAAAARLREAGAPVLGVWCPLADEPRRSFLASAGLAPDGAQRQFEVPGAEPLHEVRLVAALAEDPGAEPAAE
ncbi:MAG: GNAT family N-acetyltransferase [Micrococcales bacterium]|nr:MAG: GNAT family N-acetyltransferase [Micrococcales bacterium]PIE26648.1 MAG: GNAT family N-acetyltransferase [Micrococcales bacterium]